MVAVYHRNGEKITKENTLDNLGAISLEKFIWIDLNFSSDEEKSAVEKLFNVRLQTKQQAEEIEQSSRYIESEDHIIVNSNFLVEKEDGYNNEAVSFILVKGTLISYRNADLKSFADTVKKYKVNPQAYSDGYAFLVSFFEMRIDHEADLLENISRNITAIGRTLSLEKEVDEELLLKITHLQETTMSVRENILDNQRVISSMLKSDKFPDHHKKILRIMIKDITSLLEHTNFNFERMEYLQNSFLGLVNIEQNKIIKIFTVVSVIFMPPTLIASIYGMNFKGFFPELTWQWGYPFAIVIMVASSVVTLYLFRKKKWL